MSSVNVRRSQPTWRTRCTSVSSSDRMDAEGGRSDFLQEYDKSFLEMLWKKEAGKSRIRMTSPQLKYRGYLIMRLTSVVEEMDMGSHVLHAAARLLDYFMDSHDITVERLLPVAFSCLFIATKFEFEGRKLPQFRTICEVAQIEMIPNCMLLTLELSILRNVQWDLCTPNVSTFLDFFSQYAISPEDQDLWETVNPYKWNVTKYDKDYNIFIQMKKKLGLYLSVTLLDVQFTQLPPSLLASSCLLASRKGLGLDPWPSYLKFLTRYSISQLEIVATRLKKMLERRNIQCKRRHSTNTSDCEDEDQGYSTGKSSSEGSVKRYKANNLEMS